MKLIEVRQNNTMIVYADRLEQAEAASRDILDVKVERVEVAANEVVSDRVAAAAQSSYDARDDSSHNSDDGSTGSWEAPAVLKTATSYSARQSVSNPQDGSSSKPASDAGGGDVVAERDSIADRDNSYIYHFNWSTTGGGGVVAGRKSGEVSPEHPRPSTPEYMADLEACALESELHHVREALAQAHHGQRIAEHVRDIIGHGIHGASSDDGLSDDCLSDGGPYSMGSADSPREAVLKRFEACY